jgi:hypothetical protein
MRAEEREVQRHAETELIGPRDRRTAQELLGSHEGGRADEPSRRRHRRDERGVAFEIRRTGFHPVELRRDLHRSGESEIGDAHAPVASDEHVGRLEIPVHDLHGVGGGEPAPRLDERLDDRGPRGPLDGEPAGERLPLHQLHHDEDLLFVRTDVEHRHDVGVRQLRHRLRLAQEPPLLAQRLGRLVGAQQLERDVAPELGIASPVHDAGRAHADDVTDDVPRDLRARRERPAVRSPGRNLCRLVLKEEPCRLGHHGATVRTPAQVFVDAVGLVSRELSLRERKEHFIRQTSFGGAHGPSSLQPGLPQSNKKP